MNSFTSSLGLICVFSSISLFAAVHEPPCPTLVLLPDSMLLFSKMGNTSSEKHTVARNVSLFCSYFLSKMKKLIILYFNKVTRGTETLGLCALEQERSRC